MKPYQLTYEQWGHVNKKNKVLAKSFFSNFKTNSADEMFFLTVIYNRFEKNARTLLHPPNGELISCLVF
jgi:hypothetical protein